MRLNWRDIDLGKGPINTSLTTAETDELTYLTHNGSAVLEIGAAFGYSAIVMARAGGFVSSVDTHAAHTSSRIMVDNLVRYGVLERVDMCIGSSQTWLPKMHDIGCRFDLIFIDGDHTRFGVEHDIRWSIKLLRPTGVIVMHDYGEETCPGVSEAINAWREPDSLVDTLATFNGLGS